jgi:hypothetical protein
MCIMRWDVYARLGLTVSRRQDDKLTVADEVLVEPAFREGVSLHDSHDAAAVGNDGDNTEKSAEHAQSCLRA